MIVGIDVGFGWTKIVSENNIIKKFPTWLAYNVEVDSLPEVATVRYDGRLYVVGKDVKIMAQKIEISDINELIKYSPIFVKYAEKLVKDKIEKVVTGVPIKYRNQKDKLKAAISDLGIECEVLPQGFGIFADVVDTLITDEVLILDIGYNTLDYLIALKDEEEGWAKKRGNTIDKLGVIRALEFFRDELPNDFSHVRNYSFSRLLEIFERGSIHFEEGFIDVSKAKMTAIESHTELIKTRLREELGEGALEINTIVIAGGGANLTKIDLFKGAKKYIPEKPEFSQARGYLKYALKGIEY